MASRKHRADSGGTAASNGEAKNGTSSNPFARSFSLSAGALLVAAAVRWGARSPRILFEIGSFEDTGHYEGSAVYESVYDGVHPFLKCTWARNFCRAYVRVESCPSRPAKYDQVRSIADQVRYMERHGPNAFHLRVVGGSDIQALSVIDFGVSRLAGGACLYSSRPIDLRTPGEVAFEMWHMYSNFTGWKILNPHTVLNPSDSIAYPRRTFTGFDKQNVMTHDYGFYTVPKMFSLRIRSKFLARRYDVQRKKSFRPVNDSERMSGDRRTPLCKIENIHPGAWMTEPGDATASSACFERMKRLGGPTPEIFDDCIRSIRFVPESCELARYDNMHLRHLLYHGGVGPLVRNASTGAKLRKIILIGDSHARTFGNGLIYRLSDPIQRQHQAQFHLPVVHEFPAMSPMIGGQIEVHYCLMTNPARDAIETCLASRTVGLDDILVLGSAAWPLSTHESGQIQTPEQYRAALQGVRSLILDRRYMTAGHIYWMSSIAQPLVDSHYWEKTSDHRNDGLNSLLNQIARETFVGTPVRYFDVFNLTLPMDNASPDNAHYSLFVMKEMVNALLTDMI